MNGSQTDLSSRLRTLSSELRALNKDLKTIKSDPDLAVLHEFRQSIDDVRLTSWTLNELITARESKKSPETVLSFLAGERLRRMTQMMKDVCADVDHQLITWKTAGVQTLSDAVILLQSKITGLIAKHRASVHRAGD